MKLSVAIANPTMILLVSCLLLLSGSTDGFSSQKPVFTDRSFVTQSSPLWASSADGGDDEAARLKEKAEQLREQIRKMEALKL